MLEIELHAGGPVEQWKTENYPGDGEVAQVKGDVYRITIRRGGESQFSIGISDSGALTITDYAGMCYEQIIPQNFTLRPHRPWPRD